jgi:hypothetical protein
VTLKRASAYNFLVSLAVHFTYWFNEKGLGSQDVKEWLCKFPI